MTKVITLWDPNTGASTLLSVAIAALSGLALVAPTVTGGLTSAAVPGSGVSATFATTNVAGLTASQLATFSGGLTAPPTGTVIANGVTPVSVVDANVTASSIIILTLKTAGGTVSVNPPSIHTITPATGFSIIANASDTSTYNYLRIG